MNRREFVVRAGSVVLVLPGVGWLGCVTARAGKDPLCANDACADMLVFTSTESYGHRHTVQFSPTTFRAPPPGGVEKRTSFDQGHLHVVRVSEELLAAVGRGETVEIPTTVDAGHAHNFTLSVQPA